MEVCGGHTHSIYKYGVDDLLPANVELVHGPGCPVCVIPMGRVDDGIAIAHEPEVIFTCFGDMLRVPGADGTLLDAKAEGADVRMVYSPLDALRIAAREPRPRGRVLRHRLRDDGALDRPDAEARARPSGSRNFLVHLQPRHDRAAAARAAGVARPAARRLHRPGPRLDGRRRRPFEFIPADYGKPVVVSGFEPLDLLQSVLMILRQLAEGRCEVENQYARVVPYEGNLRALRGDGRGLRAAPALRVARARLHLAERAAALGRLRATSTPRCATRCPACASPTPRRASAARC